MRTTLLSALGFGLFAIACNNDSGLNAVIPKNVGETAIIEGRVCDPARGVWLEGADVYMHLFDTSGSLYSTIQDETDAEGRFQLVDVPIDEMQPIYVQYGNQVIDQFEVDAELGQTVIVLPDPVCAGVSGRMAVIKGDYDDFAETLDALGFDDYVEINGQTGDELVQFLSNTKSMGAFDVIFFGGGHIEEDIFHDTDGSDTTGQVAAVQAAILAYVDAGGKIVASDWSYDVVESVWPDRLTFAGTDGTPDDAQRGESGTVRADVVDGTMAASIGEERVEVNFDLIEFPIIEGTDERVTTYLQGRANWRVGETTGTTDDSPLLVSFSHGDGVVWFSTFRFGSNLETSAEPVILTLLNSL